MSKLAARLVISLGIAGLFLWWLASQGFEIIPSLEHVEAVVSIPSLLTYAGLFTVFHTMRAWRWTYLLRPFARVENRVMMETAFAGFLAIQMMPLRTGEVARPYLLDRYAGISKSSLFGTIAIERVVDGLVVSLSLTIALFNIPSNRGPYIWGLRLIPLTIFATALVLLVAFHRSPAAVTAMLRKLLGIFSQRLADFAVGVIERFHGGLAVLPDMRGFWAFVGMTCAYWAINGLAFYLLAQDCRLPLSYTGAIAGMGVLAVGILLPAGPGYFGNFQLAVVAALEMYLVGVTEDVKASVFVFALYVLQTGLTILFGAAASAALLKRPRVRRE